MGENLITYEGLVWTGHRKERTLNHLGACDDFVWIFFCLYCSNFYTEKQYTMIFYFDSLQTRMKREVGKIVPLSFGGKL